MIIILRSARPSCWRDGGDVLVISCGEMTMRALDAAEDLEKEGIHVAVLHSPHHQASGQ